MAAVIHALGAASIDVSRPRHLPENEDVIAVELVKPPPVARVTPTPSIATAIAPLAPPVKPRVRLPQRRKKVTLPVAQPTPESAPPPRLSLSMRRGLAPDLSPPRPPVAPATSKVDTRTRQQPDDGSAAAIKRRLDKLLASDRAQRNVAQGRVAPALYEIERKASKAFTPKWSLSEGSARRLGRIGPSLARTLRGFAKAYLERLETYAKLPADKEEERPKMLEGYRRMARAAEKEAGLLSCELCVTFRLGAEPAIRVKERSDNGAFDRLAKRALARALRLQGKRHPAKGEACYRFAAKFHRVPPLPMVGCTFDEVHLRAECFYPFKKILRRDVTLLSVDEG